MSERSDAPGALEQVRTFLNTWVVPNDTRAPVDTLPEIAARRGAWQRAMPGVVPPQDGRNGASVTALQDLRNDLRAVLGQARPSGLTDRLRPLRWQLEVGSTSAEPVTLAGDPQTTETMLLAIVVRAIADGTWHRLRACPDCGWVFYDSSRNARRTWCSMGTSGGARGCGSIAKTRAYRARKRAAAGAARAEEGPVAP